jgi:hypothetical protein
MTLRFLRRARPVLLCLVTASCLTACVTIGRSFPTQGVPSLAIGSSTQADIQRIYGSPFRTGVQDGDVTWTYVNYKLRVFGEQCTQDLVVRFNANGVVKSFTYNTTSAGSCG